MALSFTTTAQINRYIDSGLDYRGQLVYMVNYTGDDGGDRSVIFFDHADAYAFVRDEILGYKEVI